MNRDHTSLRITLASLTLGLSLAACQSASHADPVPGDAARAHAQNEMGSLCRACRAYASANHSFPDSLAVLVVKDANGHTFLDDRTALPLDPWGTRYVYERLAEGKQCQLVSLGADRQVGGSGENADIVMKLSMP